MFCGQRSLISVCLLVALLIQKMLFFKEGFLSLQQISEVLLQWMNKANVKSGEWNAGFKIRGCFIQLLT